MKKPIVILIILTFCFSGQVLALEIEKETTEVTVTDIKINSYNAEMTTGETQSLTVTVLPQEAADTLVSYSSSNETVLTVNSFGEIEALAKGCAVVTIHAGDIEKAITISVRVKTTAINLNKTYLILKPGQTFTVRSDVLPAESEQRVSYQSLDPRIASVSDRGVIKGLRTGMTSVMVSNQDQSSVVTVIVNETGSFQEAGTVEEKTGQELLQSENTASSLVDIIKNSTDRVQISGEEYSVLAKEIFKELYESGKSITMEYESYRLVIKGEDIRNYNNVFTGSVMFEQTEEGKKFALNEGNKLPSVVMLELSEELQGRYLYLYNEETKKYQQLKMDDPKALQLDEGGAYLIAQEKISGLRVSYIYVIGGTVILLILAGVYVGVKKKHWFW